MEVSERRVCRIVGQARSTQRQEPKISEEESLLRERIVALACAYGRYGYRRITSLLRNEGWRVNHKRVERIWRQEGLKVPKKQPKRRRLWLNDGSCIRLRPERKDHVWSYDFVSDRTSNGKLRDELLNREVFDTALETRVLAERYRWEYNTIRPPAPEAILPLQTASA